MTRFEPIVAERRPTPLGLVVLQSDETIEREMRRLMPTELTPLVSRVPSATDVSLATLGAMEAHLTAAAALFPRGLRLRAVGYGCTSGAAHIGPARVAERIRAGVETACVSDPTSALIDACAALGVARLAVLSPYVAPVSERLRAVLSEAGVETLVFGSFNEPSEAAVARIAPASTYAAAKTLAAQGAVDAVFLSCTNVPTIDVIADLERDLGRPVLASNQVLAWRLLRAVGRRAAIDAPGKVFQTLDDAADPEAG